MSQCHAGGVSFPHGPYMIGAGVCRSPMSTMEWLKIAPVVSGSYTPEQRPDNCENSLWPETAAEWRTPAGSLSSYDMPNMGFTEALSNFASMSQPDRPIVVSVAGFSISDYLTGIKKFSALPGVSAIELNFGCLNMLGESPEIVSFRPEVIRKLLGYIISYDLRTKPIWLKFSPYSNPSELKRIAELVNEYAQQSLVAVVTCNTFPCENFGAEKTSANARVVGLSGAVMKPIALGQVRQFRHHLDESVDVIGVGGITTGDDIMDFLEAGAAAVQITSLAHLSGSRSSFLQRLLDEETASRLIAHLS